MTGRRQLARRAGAVKRRGAFAAIALAGTLAACGQKGPLVLPDAAGAEPPSAQGARRDGGVAAPAGQGDRTPREDDEEGAGDGG